MSGFSDPNPDYWIEYGSFQRVKHDLIRAYLGGWFPKLGTWAGRVLYVDTHAGRGRHVTGEPGSPLVALETFLYHSAPAFVFVDPYGFKVPAQVLADLMGAGRVELFINVIWRELDMAVQQRPEPGEGMASTLDTIFGGEEWRTEITAPEVHERMSQAVRLLARKVGAKWWTYVRMVTGGQATRYILLHLTNHDRGRDLIKDCVWSIIPEGGFEVLKSEDPRQPMLIEREPDFAPLRAWVIDKLQTGAQRWSGLEVGVRSTHWRTTHLNDVVRTLRREEAIVADDFVGRFSRTADPLLRLP